jgi:DNA-binding CsgD family transcriptional regulator
MDASLELSERPAFSARSHSPSSSLAPQLAGPLVARLLDEIDVGLAVIDASARVVFANRAAHRESIQGGRCRVDGGLARPARSADNGAFGRALRTAVSGLRTLAAFEGEDGPGASHVAFIPLDTSPESPAMVLLLFGRHQVCGSLSAQFFARQHGVTLAESWVLAALCDGGTPRSIAQQRGIAISTVRTQISNIRQKTGARSILELLRAVSMLPPLVAIQE